jgi:hypothetical protein
VDLDSNNLNPNSSENKKLNDSADTFEIASVSKGKTKSKNKEPNPKLDKNELDSKLKSNDTKEKFSYFMDSIEALLAKSKYFLIYFSSPYYFYYLHLFNIYSLTYAL